MLKALSRLHGAYVSRALPACAAGRLAPPDTASMEFRYKLCDLGFRVAFLKKLVSVWMGCPFGEAILSSTCVCPET